MKKEDKTINWEPREENLYLRGYTTIAGIDEAGCGPLAGPVVAAAVILPLQRLNDPTFLLGLNDSKKLSDKQKDRLYEEITKESIYAVGIATSKEIDSVNIRQADYLAMERAIKGLILSPDALLVDAWHLSFWPGFQLGIPQGDAKVRSIAAASIVAKVTRDRLMIQLDLLYPNYGFARHKGYGTKAHYEAIAKYGLTPEHRLSFLRNLDFHLGE